MMIRIRVEGGSGRVVEAEISDGGTRIQGRTRGFDRCVVRVLERIRYPRFQRDSMTVNYPYRL